MPKVVPPEETPDNQQQRQNNGAVVTRETSSSSRPKRSCARYPNRDDSGSVGTPAAKVNQLFSPTAASTSNDVTAAADALVGLSDAQEGSGHQDQDFSGEKSLNKDAASAAGTKIRKSKRILEKLSTNSNKKKKTGEDDDDEENDNEDEDDGEDEDEDKKLGKTKEEQVKLGDWRVFHPGTSSKFEELRKKRGIYIILMPNGTIKIGCIYSDDDSVHIFGNRIRQIVVHFIEPVHYIFLDTGSILSKDGVKAVETMGHFALFTLTMPDGKSRYAGASEQFYANQDMCDVLLEKLKQYAITGDFKMNVGGGNVAVKAKLVERKKHPKWIHFHYKFFGKKHHRDDCRWRGDVGDDEDWDRANRHWNDWCDFARGFDKRCTCMENRSTD